MGRRAVDHVVVVLGLVVVCLGAGVTVPGLASATRLSPVTLSAPGALGTYPQIALDGRGRGVAMWAELDGSGIDYAIKSSSHPAHKGHWTRPVTLSTPGQFADFPQLAVSPSGVAVAVWVAGGVAAAGTPVSPPVIEASFRDPGTGVWQAPAAISPPDADSGQATVAIDADGEAVATWTTRKNNLSEIETATGKGASWSAPVVLATGPQADLNDPQVAVDRRGGAIVVWKRYTGGGVLNSGVTNTILAAVRRAGRASWRRPFVLGAEAEQEYQGSANFVSPGPRVAVNGRGDAVVTWQAKQRGRFVIAAAHGTLRDRHWARAKLIPRSLGIQPDVGIDRGGDATVVWTGPRGSVVTAIKRANHGWSSPRTLFRGNPNVDPTPQIAVNPSGDAIVTWQGYPARLALRESAAGVWSRPIRLDTGGVTDSALAPSGAAAAIWQHPFGHSMLIQAVRYTPSRKTRRYGP